MSLPAISDRTKLIYNLASTLDKNKHGELEESASHGSSKKLEDSQIEGLLTDCYKTATFANLNDVPIIIVPSMEVEEIQEYQSTKSAMDRSLAKVNSWLCSQTLDTSATLANLHAVPITPMHPMEFEEEVSKSHSGYGNSNNDKSWKPSTSSIQSDSEISHVSPSTYCSRGPILSKNVKAGPLNSESIENDPLTPNSTERERERVLVLPGDNPAATTVDNITPQKSSSKKRKRNIASWKKEVKKSRRNLGLDYETVKGKKVRKREVKAPCGGKCRLQCTTKISDQKRNDIFTAYWKLGDITRQRDYINKNSEESIPKYQYKKQESTRSNNLKFSFTIDNEKTIVCKTFFKNTLDINDTTIRIARDKLNDIGITDCDKRGKHLNRPSYNESDKEHVRSHIKSFPRIESHYLRSQTKRDFIDGSLNLSEMYRLYLEFCSEKELCPVSKSMYSNIFNYEFNISFFSPKKDQCSICEEYKNTTTKTEELTSKYEAHCNSKENSRKELYEDIENSKSGPGGLLFYDLQAVLPSPCGEISSFYYKRRLSTYNLSVFDSKKKLGYCFTWYEGIAKRGAIEIGSCILKYIEKFAEKGIDLLFYSDNCNGQQKNKFMYSLYMYIVMFLDVPSITHKFLTTGHTQMPVDSMHSRIQKEKERALKSGPIYCPSQWMTVMKLAKKTGQPYNVYEMETKDFIDLPNLCQVMGSNFQVNIENQKVLLSEAVVIRVEKETPFILYYKTDFSEKEYSSINVRSNSRRNKVYCMINDIGRPTPFYKTPPPISREKKEDLLSLCNSNLIPEQYHSFYSNLPVEKTKKSQKKTVS